MSSFMRLRGTGVLYHCACDSPFSTARSASGPVSE